MRLSLSCLRMDEENCCKVLFQKQVIFSSFTKSAAEIALLDLDLLFICIEINLTVWGGGNGWNGWNVCSLNDAAATAHSQVPLSGRVREMKTLHSTALCVDINVKDGRFTCDMCDPSISHS